MVTEYFNKAWAAYKNNFWQISGAMITFMFIILFFISIITFSLSIYTTPMTPENSHVIIKSVSGAAQIELRDTAPAPNPLMLLVEIALLLIMFLVTIALGAGIVRIYADALKGKAKIKTMFTVAKQKFLTIVGAKIIVMLIVIPLYLLAFVISLLLSGTSELLAILYFMLLLIPIMFFSILFSLTDQAVVIGNYSALESVKKSFNVVKSNYLEFLALILISIIILLIFSLIPFIGSFINFIAITPIIGIAYTAFYLDKTHAGRTLKKKKIGKRNSTAKKKRRR